MAVGEGRTTSEGGIAECPFKPGDSVKFLEYAPIEIKVRLVALSAHFVATTMHRTALYTGDTLHRRSVSFLVVH